MPDITPRKIKTGGDPRTLADYAILRDELSKLAHPARPDVNWRHVEKLCLSLFKQNGVELQTAAWYTLARTQLAGLLGLNEGLAIIEALVSHQWGTLWPQQVHARAEIINGLFQRLQKLFRTFSLGHGDMPALLQTEGLLRNINGILARQELKHACQTAPLTQQIQSALSRLENSPPQGLAPQAVMLPAQALASAEEETSPIGHLVYVIRPEPEVSVQVVHETPPPPRRWLVFLAGACSALVVCTVVLTGWHYAHRMDSASQALTASVAPLPQALNQKQMEVLRQKKPDARAWLKQASAQLEVLSTLPPDWTLQQGNSLVKLAQEIWPDDPDVVVLQKKWHEQRAVNVLAPQALTGWHEGMTQLQALSEQLEQLDRQRGKYLTGSELKSMVFRMMTSFRQTIPLEEQLRALRAPQRDGEDPVTQQQAQRHLSALLNMYAEKTSATEDKP